VLRITEISNAQLKVRRFCYSNKLSFALADHAPELDVEELEFYFIHEDTTIEAIRFPVHPLYSVNELWIDFSDRVKDASLYTKPVFDTYSYKIISPF